MQDQFSRVNLQLFADGASAAGAGDGAAASGVSAGDPSPQSSGVQSGDPSRRLAELGVPQELIDRQAKRLKKRGIAKAAQPKQAAAAEPQSEPTQPQPEPAQKPDDKNAVAVTDWDTFFANPDNKKRYEDTISARVKESKGAKDTLDKLSPALAAIGRIYGVDTSDTAKIDFDKLNAAIAADDPEIENKAVELGVDREIAQQLVEAERMRSELQRIEGERQERQKETQQALYLRQHWDKLNADAEQLKAKYPSFDLTKALENESFARLTAPGVNVPLETAYRAAFGEELDRQLVQKTKESISSSLMSGQRRPAETGANAPAASAIKAATNMRDPKNRAEIKRRMLEAERMGKKYYPDGTIK